VIIIINGPLGIGKTEVSWELLRHFERGVMLDGDYIGAVEPFEIYNDARIEYLYKTIRHLVTFHKEDGGYENFVINYVFETPESLAQLRHLLLALDDRIYIFRLTCDPEELANRIRGRGHDTDSLTWELERAQELAAIQEEASRQGDLGYTIDTTGLSRGQVAEDIWRRANEQVKLATNDPYWAAVYEAERADIAAALGELAVDIQHIGSTSVPDLVAKPVIDILVAVNKLDDAIDCIPPLQVLGYTFIDHPENTDRRFFSKGHPRTHHLHIVEYKSQAWSDHIDFRNTLRADRHTREKYANLKVEMAQRYAENRTAYTKAKSDFIQGVLANIREVT
jgi:GrpB-like predicted nucleotidyltransferase (UPF0157 family)